MHILSPEKAMLLAYGAGIFIPPFLAALLFHQGVANDTKARALPLALSALTLILWMPVLLAAPQVLISLFYPAN